MNGSVLLADPGITTYGVVATQMCDIGYNLLGEVNITCTADGNWSDPVAICKIKGKLESVCIKQRHRRQEVNQFWARPSPPTSRTQND